MWLRGVVIAMGVGVVFIELIGLEVTAFDSHYIFVAASEESGKKEAGRAAVCVAFTELAAPAWGVAVVPRHVGVVWGDVFQCWTDGIHNLPRCERSLRAWRDGDDRSVPRAARRREVDGVGFPCCFHSVGDEELLCFEGVEEVYFHVVGGVRWNASGAFSEEVQVFDGAFD